MSTNVKSVGKMAVLLSPIPKDERDELNEKLYDDSSSDFQINYEGTIVYSNVETKDDIYGMSINSGQISPVDLNFVSQLSDLGMQIDESTIRNYSCIWYNGVDSDMDMLTLEQYMDSIT